MLPSQFIPRSVQDFIGPARATAVQLQKIVATKRANGNAPVKIMFNGDPGIGKSALAEFLVTLLGANPGEKWSYKKFNGTQIKLENIEEIAASLHYRSIYGDYNIVWIEEADTVTPAAQVRFLTLLDDLPNGSAVICTSNCKLSEFKKRFQTRFMIYEMEAPNVEEIVPLLRKFHVPEQHILQIANLSCGNVRAALLDAELALQV